MMRAILVCVDYSDILAITLPHNRHHFDDVMVVTTPDDFKTLEVAITNQCQTFVSTDFYYNGADFNKWLPLEHALDAYGREGLLCIMDADVLWPKKIDQKFEYKHGCLYTPKRRMLEDLSMPIPKEKFWDQYPLHPQQREFAGYTQIFHANDPVLDTPPWHQTNWRHAGGADSFFQMKWHEDNKVRPPFEVLHLGPAGVNWCGRSSPYLDGSQPLNSAQRKTALDNYLSSRTRAPDRFKQELLPEEE